VEELARSASVVCAGENVASACQLFFCMFCVSIVTLYVKKLQFRPQVLLEHPCTWPAYGVHVSPVTSQQHWALYVPLAVQYLVCELTRALEYVRCASACAAHPFLYIILLPIFYALLPLGIECIYACTAAANPASQQGAAPTRAKP
jgi:hypothetical protein